MPGRRATPTDRARGTAARQRVASRAGDNVHSVRTRLGLTQERLAEAIVGAAADDGLVITLTASAISRWERGIYEPALRYRPFLARALGVDVRDLFPFAPAVHASSAGVRPGRPRGGGRR